MIDGVAARLPDIALRQTFLASPRVRSIRGSIEPTRGIEPRSEQAVRGFRAARTATTRTGESPEDLPEI